MNYPELNVYRFKTESGNEYLYDNVSGIVFPCSEAMHYTISNFYKVDKDNIIDYLQKEFNLDFNGSLVVYNYVKTMLDNDCFYKKENQLVQRELTEEDLYKTSLSQLILIVTEDCNMRCKYCMYSDNYPHVKGYSKKQMSMDVAKKAIDYYIDLHLKRVDHGFKREPVINFFGGEPLLEFELMKNIVKYCKEKDYNPVLFITTNFTLFNDEIMNFIIDNDVVLTISLDGSKKNNDRNRIFPNGRGSYGLIMENIIKLQNEKKRRNKEQALTFSCCFDSYTDMCDTVSFFEANHDMFYPYNVIYNQISKYNTTYYEYCDNAYDNGLIKEDKNTLNNSVQILKDEFLNSAIMNESSPSIGLTYLFFGLINIIWRTKGLMPNLNNSACIPGSKIAVDPDGKFYVCERMAQSCSIGDVDNKISVQKVINMSNEYLSIIGEHCKDCNISRLCSMCYTHLAKDDKLEFNHQMCKDNKISIPKAMETVFSVLEKNPNAFDMLIPDETNREFFEIIK